MIFLNIEIFLHPQIPDFQILSKPYINGNIINSAFINMDPFDWFCAPGSDISLSLQSKTIKQSEYFSCIQKNTTNIMGFNSLK